MTPNIESFNIDELDPPDWLNAEFFTKVLKSSKHCKELQVKNVKISPASFKGDHYASVMFRAAVDYVDNIRKEDHSISLIIKTMPEVEGHKKDMLGESHIFETEIGMYTEVLPKFEEILRSIGDETILKAPCLYHSLSPRKLIIFEDIVPQGYTVLRNRYVNIEEAKMAYLKLSKIHAISYKLNKECPEMFEKYQHGLMTIQNMVDNDFMKDGIDNFIELLEKEPGLVKYKPYFESLKPHLYSNSIKAFKEYSENKEEGAAYVLCHGDFHFKNFMFKNNSESGKLEDLMLIDFQMSYMGSIVNDLIYSIYMVLDADLRLNKLDELLHYYFTAFLKTLKKIGYDGPLPKMFQLRQDMMSHRDWELYLLVSFLPVWYAFNDSSLDLNQMMTSKETRKQLFQNKKFLAELHHLLPRYLHLGYLEV